MVSLKKTDNNSGNVTGFANKLYRFLLVNEDDIIKSDDFLETFGMGRDGLENCKEEFEHNTRILLLLYYAEDILNKDSAETKYIVMKNNLKGINQMFVEKTADLSRKFKLSPDFLNLIIKMYSIYKMHLSKEQCSEQDVYEDYHLLKEMFCFLENAAHGINKELDNLMEQYKEMFILEKEVAVWEPQKARETRWVIRRLRQLFVVTCGLNKRYINPKRIAEYSHIRQILIAMSYMMIYDEKGLSPYAIIKELGEEFIKTCTPRIMSNGYAKKYREYKSGMNLQNFIKFIKHTKTDINLDELKEEIFTISDNFLINYRKILLQLRDVDVLGGLKLDIESEIIKLDNIIEEFYGEKQIGEVHQKKDYSDDTGSTGRLFESMKKLQISKVKKISDDIVNAEKRREDKEVYSEESMASGIEMEFFQNLDASVRKLFKEYKDKGAFKIRKSTQSYKFNLDYDELLHRVSEDNKLIKYRNTKNRFYVCTDKKKPWGIMTLPYKNMDKECQNGIFGRAAVIFDCNYEAHMAYNSRGASWGFGDKDRQKMNYNGTKIQLYRGNSITINNGSNKLIEEIAKAAEINQLEKEDGKTLGFKHNKFDYRAANISYYENTKYRKHEKDYYLTNTIPWVRKDSPSNIFDKTAVLYIDTAKKLKSFLDKI